MEDMTTRAVAQAWDCVGQELRPPLDGQKILRRSTSHRMTPNLIWGRAQRRSWIVTVACLFMITIPPSLTILFYIALEHFDCSLSATLLALHLDGFLSFCSQYAPVPSIRATIGYAMWVLFQAVLYTALPGRSTGQLTPAGYLLEYPTNGLLAWLVTAFLAAIATFSGIVDPATLVDHWEGLVVTLNVYGYVLAAIAYFKAHYAPSHALDRKFSGQKPANAKLSAAPY